MRDIKLTFSNVTTNQLVIALFGNNYYPSYNLLGYVIYFALKTIVQGTESEKNMSSG